MKRAVLTVILFLIAVIDGVGADSRLGNKDIIEGPARVRHRQKRHGDLSNFSNFTKLIDSMLDPSKYDMKLRPNFGGEPTTITIEINIRSMGPVSEIDSLFQMDCYFRQSWYDPRLKYDSAAFNKSMLLSTHVLGKIWSPDTYFTNGKESYRHVITVPNLFIRIDNKGKISFSQRLTIKSMCSMNLKHYPLDSQSCKLSIGSFGYKREDILLRWSSGNDSVKMTENITMSQFQLLDRYVTQYNFSRMNRSDDYGSTLEVTFIMKRSAGYYLLNIYIPSGMLVVLSWVTFWLNREASAARVALGIMTILTSVTIGISSRSDLPKVDYTTALDIYIIMTLGYVTAAFVVYAGVNYFTKISKPDDCKPIYAFKPEELMPPSPLTTTRMPYKNCFEKFFFCFLGHVGYRAKLKAHKNEMNSVSKIDVIARCLFPVSFVILNILYWVAYGLID